MNLAPVIAGIAFGLLAQAPPAIAGGVLLCNEYGCRSSPYFPPPIPFAGPPVVYMPPPGQEQRYRQPAPAYYPAPPPVVYAPAPLAPAQAGPPVGLPDPPARVTAPSARAAPAGSPRAGRAEVSPPPKVSGGTKEQREIESGILDFCRDHGDEPFCGKLGDYLRRNPRPKS